MTVVLAHGSPLKRCKLWLIIDMVAPILGVLSTLFFKLPATVIPWLLAYFAGFFLYLGASDMLPDAQESKSPAIAIATVGGMALIYCLMRFLPN